MTGLIHRKGKQKEEHTLVFCICFCTEDIQNDRSRAHGRKYTL